MLIFVHIPAVHTVWTVAGLGIFGLYTVVDFNRLRRAGTEEASSSRKVSITSVMSIDV